MQHIESNSPNTLVYYFTTFSLFSPEQAQLLCSYKQFIENVIMKLGQDWRIQSGLLAQDIIAIRTQSLPGKDYTNFNIFNQFLSSFLLGKIGKEMMFTGLTDSHMQQSFLETLMLQFHQSKIHGSLTYKTLSLGYSITATQIWNKIFKHSDHKSFKKICSLKPFGKLCTNCRQQNKIDFKSNREASSVRRILQRIDIVSSHFSWSQVDQQSDQKQEQLNDKEWKEIQMGQLSQCELKQIKLTIQRIEHKLDRTQLLCYFVCFIDELRLKDGRRVRVFSLANQFYLNAFIVWLIFNIKMFFSLNFIDYLKFFRQLMQQNWKNEYERPLKKFQLILQRQWNKLMKDYTVALYDDLEVLHILIDRVKKQIEMEWQARTTSLKTNFPKKI